MISPGPSTGLGAAGAFPFPCLGFSQPARAAGPGGSILAPLECLVSAPASFGMCQAGNLEARPLPRSRLDSLLERTLSQSLQTRGNRAWSSCRDALGQRAPAWHQIGREDKRPGDSGAEFLTSANFSLVRFMGLGRESHACWLPPPCRAPALSGGGERMQISVNQAKPAVTGSKQGGLHREGGIVTGS